MGARRTKARKRWKAAGRLVQASLRLHSIHDRQQREREEDEEKVEMEEEDDEEEEEDDYSLVDRLKVVALILFETVGESLVETVSDYPALFLGAALAINELLAKAEPGTPRPTPWQIFRSVGVKGLYKGFVPVAVAGCLGKLVASYRHVCSF